MTKITKIKLKDGTIADIGGGTEVVANPTEQGTEDLTKLQVGNTIYNIPQGTSTDELLGTWVFGSNDVNVNGSSYNVTFTSNRQQFTSISTTPFGDPPYFMYFGSVSVWENNSWINTAYKTITITDTSSLTNREEFTTWLKANATKQGESGGGGTNVVANPTGEGTENLTKLQVGNTVYNIPQGTSTDELLGTWVFKDTISLISVDNTEYFVFKATNSAQEEITSFGFVTGMLPGLWANPLGASIYDGGRVGTWNYDTYKTITITDTSSLTNREEFTTWLKANATKQGSSGSSTNGYTVKVMNNSRDGHAFLYNTNDEFIQVSAGEIKTVENVKCIKEIMNMQHNITIKLFPVGSCSFGINNTNGLILVEYEKDFNENQFPMLIFSDFTIVISGGGSTGGTGDM